MRILSTAKFLPFGTIVPLRAGALNVSSWRFVILDAISSTFYASVYVLLGFFFHEQLEQLVALIKRLGLLSLALVAILVAACLSYRFLKGSKKYRNNSELGFLGFGEALAKEEARGEGVTEPKQSQDPKTLSLFPSLSVFENDLKGRWPKSNDAITSQPKPKKTHV
jgi:hypothetical protein